MNNKNRMKEIRIAQNISILELSRKVEVSERHIRFIEAGTKNPSLQVAQKIATELKTSIDEIF